MSQFNSQVQSPDWENQQPAPISTPYNLQSVASSHESSAVNGDASHVTYTTQSQLPQQTPVINTPVQIIHPTVFFFRPPNDVCHYHVICKEISYDDIGRLLNKPSNGN